MAVTELQARVLRLLARQRRERGESYVGGGVALNTLLAAARRSRDIDLFHDTEDAVWTTWDADRELLEASGLEIRVLREAAAFVEAMVTKGTDRTVMQWARDSAYRFFPLVENDVMGLSLHPFDLATNKVLAMAGRLEVRDWVDVLICHERLQPFGYLVWAACGKDPGYNPRSLLAAAARMHYSRPEVDTLDFEGTPPDAAVLGQTWHMALDSAKEIGDLLPSSEAGTCVVTEDLDLFRGDPSALVSALASGAVVFHEGRIGGSWPRVVQPA